MAPSTFKVFFDIQNIDTDVITSVGGLQAVPPIPASDLVDQNPQFWLEKDTNGKSFLCTTKTDVSPLNASLNGGSGPYDLIAQNFQVVDVIGGHPVSKPGGKGG